MPLEAAGGWRRLHPVTILRELLGVAWNLVVAVIVLGALEGGGVERLEVLVPLAFFAVAVGRYYSTRYLITPDAVLWRRGILFRRRLEVPRSRIQNVSSGADVLGRIFGLRTVTISTAGSEGEIELALVSSEEASFLLADLLGTTPTGPPARPTGAAPPEAGSTPVAGPPPPEGPPAGTAPPPPPATAPDAPAPGRRLVTLPVRHLVVFGLTGGGLGVVLVASAVAVVVSVAIGTPRPLVFALFALGAPLMTTLELVDFELTGEVDRIRVRHGLLQTRDKWARRERIQVVEVDRPVLRSVLGFETISVATADAKVGGDSDLSLCSPMAPRGRWADLAAELVEVADVSEAELRPISPRARLRRFLRLLLAMALPAVAAVVALALTVGPLPALAAAVVAVVGGPLTAHGLARRAQRLDGYTLDDQHLLVRRGMVGSHLWLVRRGKVQSVSVRADPFQRRLGLASVHVDTANVGGAAIVVPDLARGEAAHLAAELVDHADRVFLPDGV